MSKHALRFLIRKIETIIALTNDEIEALSHLPVRIADHPKGAVLVREGDRPTQSFTVLAGVTCMYKHSAEGRRQILIFHFPGDFPDLQSLHLNVLDMSVSTMSRAKIAYFQHQDIRLLYARFPRLGEALWRISLVDAAILRERMLNLGQRAAYPRLAHFFCEMVVRMRLAEMAEDAAVPLPLTQQEIGDALGLSNIHINRVTQELREEGLIETKRGRLIVMNWKKLQKAADFDTGYLHLTPGQKLLLTH